MSFFKRLFGGDGANAPAAPVAQAEHEGYHISAEPMKEGAQFRLCAVISKEVGGETKQHRLIRADMFASADDAAQAALRKARQVIGEQGETMFD